MGVLAWIAGILLGSMMLMTGAMKLSGQQMVKETMRRLGVSDGLTKLIGVDEVLAGVGIFIGLIAGNDSNWEWAGFLAGIGVIALMTGAIVYHRRAGDPPKESVPAVMALVLAVLYLLGIMAR